MGRPSCSSSDARYAAPLLALATALGPARAFAYSDAWSPPSASHPPTVGPSWREATHPGYDAARAQLQYTWAAYRAFDIERYLSRDTGPLSPAARNMLESLRDRFARVSATLPDDAAAWLGLAEVTDQLGEYRAAAAALERAEAIPGDPPERSEILFRIGVVQTRLLDFPAARDAYETMLTLALGTSERAVALGNLAETYVYLGDLDRAVSHYQDAVALIPSYAGGWWGLMSAYDRAGREGDATRAGARALALDPDLDGIEGPNVFYVPDYERHYYMGLARELMHDTTGAVREWTAYLSAATVTDPWRDRARAHLDRLRVGPTRHDRQRP